MEALNLMDNFVLSFGMVPSLLLICVGLIGNCLTVLVFFNTKLRYVQPFLYLVALAVTDSCILIFFLVRFLLPRRLEVIKSAKGFIFWSVVDTVPKSSMWLTVAYTYNRYISLKYPMHNKSMWIVRNTKFVILSIILTFIIYENAVLLLTFTIRSSIMSIVFVVFEFVSYSLRFLMPLSLIIYFNLSTLFMMVKYRRRNTRIRNMSEQYNITRFLLISSATALFVVPYEINNAIFLLKELNVINNNFLKEPNVYLDGLFETLSIFSYCGDFFVYCLSGKLYRNGVRELFCICRKQRDNEESK